MSVSEQIARGIMAHPPWLIMVKRLLLDSAVSCAWSDERAEPSRERNMSLVGVRVRSFMRIKDVRGVW